MNYPGYLKQHYTLNVQSASPSARVVHVCAMKAYWNRKSIAPSPRSLTSGDTVPSTPVQRLSGLQRGSGRLEKSVLRLRETESIPSS